jgi:hypothetical protein
VAAPLVPRQTLEQQAVSAQLHSAALSELRGLYEPTYAPPAGSVPTARRTPAASAPPAAPAAPAKPASTPTATAPRRDRNPDDVRGMLSGFRAGVARGRTSAPGTTDGAQPGTPADTPPAPETTS